MDQASLPSDHAATGSKRRRIALACNTCRSRKSRCDGQRPTCSTCQQSKFECHYDAPDSSTNVIVRKEYVSDLEHRLREVERALQRHDDLLTGHLSACAPSASHTSHLYHESQSRQARVSPAGSDVGSGIRLDTSSLEEPGRDDAKTDGLAIAFVDEPTSAYFGESSNITFVRYLLSAISAIWNIKSPETPSTGVEEREKDLALDSALVQVPGEYSPMAMSSPHALDINSLVLPPAAEMEHLLRVYFGSHGLLFPFLHEPTFWEMYHHFKDSGFSRVRRTWLGVLYMMFAMGSNADKDNRASASEKLKQSEVFYARAVALCTDPSRRTISLDIVHYLLLAVLYLQGTKRSIQTWNLHGLLVRTAIALGVHSDHAGRHLQPLQQEVRRRTWHTIYCLDTVLSVTFGRPPAIAEQHMTAQLPNYWPSTHHKTGREGVEKMQFTTDFLSVSLKLYRIMGKSVERQFSNNLGINNQDDDEITAIQVSGELRQELRQWVSTLPSNFEVYPISSPIFSQSSELNRLRTILTLRYHSLSMLIHRPLLCATLRYLSRRKGSESTVLPYTVQLAMAEAHECVIAAETTIDIVHLVLTADKTGGNNLGVWFFTLYYVFTASLIVCARMLWARDGNHQDEDAIIASKRSYLVKAAEALTMLDASNSLVLQCAKYIRYMSKLQDGRLSSHGGTDAEKPSREEENTFHVAFGDESTANISDMLTLNSDFGSLFATELFDSSIFGLLPNSEE